MSLLFLYPPPDGPTGTIHSKETDLAQVPHSVVLGFHDSNCKVGLQKGPPPNAEGPYPQHAGDTPESSVPAPG